MITVTTHAVILMLVPIVMLIAFLAAEKRRPTGHQVAVSAIIAGGTGVFADISSAHLCSEGNPLTQWIIPALCMGVVLCYFRNALPRRILAASLFVVMLALSMHYAGVVHEPKWTGNPRGRILSMRVVFESQRQRLVEMLLVLEEERNPSYEAGWLRDLPIPRELDEQLAKKPFRESATAVWHTWFTWIYRRERAEQDYWYPGGPISEAAELIELRDR